jgi:hypothetical protein
VQNLARYISLLGVEGDIAEKVSLLKCPANGTKESSL